MVDLMIYIAVLQTIGNPMWTITLILIILEMFRSIYIGGAIIFPVRGPGPKGRETRGEIKPSNSPFSIYTGFRAGKGWANFSYRTYFFLSFFLSLSPSLISLSFFLAYLSLLLSPNDPCKNPVYSSTYSNALCSSKLRKLRYFLLASLSLRP